MEEKRKKIDDEELEILDFDDDIDELPKVELETKKELNDDISIDDIVDIDEKTLYQINNQIEVDDIEKQDITPTINELPNTIIEEPINEKVLQEVSYVEQIPTTNESVIENDEKKHKKEKNKRGKAIFAGIFIFVILMGAIISLPFLNEYVINKENSNSNNINQNNTSVGKQEFKSNIDVKKALNHIKDYNNYQYQNLSNVYTKDNKNQPLSIKTNYTYLFNETKFEIETNKVVADFSYDTKDYYEKLDDKYNIYLNDITTKTYSMKDTTKDEFVSLSSMYPKMMEYLISNYKIVNEKEVKVGTETHIDITLKVSKEILKNLLVETERIQNKLDVSKLSMEFIEVDLLFDTNNKLYRIEFEIEDKFAYQENLENEVESAILKYVFTDFNKVQDIELPTL